MDWWQIFLVLHVMGAIIGFGPVFSFPLIGAMGASEPAHSNYGLRLSKMLSDRIVIPLAVVQAVTGVLLILALHLDLTAPTSRWLISGIVLYVITFGYATAIQRKKVRALIELTSRPRPADAPPGPPPGALALIAHIQRGGILLIVLISTIVTLMVLKPAF